jgi:hypothetical protein
MGADCRHCLNTPIPAIFMAGHATLPGQMTDEEFGAFLAEANSELAEKQVELSSKHGLGAFRRWWSDQETSLIRLFDAADRIVLEAEFVPIGTFSPLSDTWLWAWANVTTLPQQREKAEKLKELAGLTGFALFEDADTFKVDEAMAWELAAVSVKHLGAKGCYRAPSSDRSNFSFLALMKLQIVQ